MVTHGERMSRMQSIVFAMSPRSLLATWFSRSNLVDVVMVCKHINVLTNVHRRIIFKTMNKNECAARKTVNPSSATSGRDPIYDIR